MSVPLVRMVWFVPSRSTHQPLFFYPKFTVSVNGVPTDSFTMRILGALAVAVSLTVFIGLPLLGIIYLFS